MPACASYFPAVRQVCVAVCIALASAGCSERVTFLTKPEGAKVYVGNMYVGDTPTIYSTRNVVTRAYRIEKAGYPEAVGTLQARVAPGRIVGAVFTLGLLAAFRPMLYYSPSLVEVDLNQNPDGKIATMAADARLYNLKSNEVATGGCDARGKCSVVFPLDGECTGESVRESQGTTRVTSGSAGTSAYGYGGAYSVGSAAAAIGRETPNSQQGVTMFRCPNKIIDCAMVFDAFGAGGHGDCKDGHGATYRLMLIPK